MSTVDKRDRSRFRRSEDSERALPQDAQLAEAAMELLGCTTLDEVYQAIGRTMSLFSPGAIILVNQIDPASESVVARAITGLDGTLLKRATDLVGFELVGLKTKVVPEYRAAMLSGTLTKIPGGLTDFASSVLSPTVVRAVCGLLGIGDVYSIGIADGREALGNVHIITRGRETALPAPLIESFARHAYSALAALGRTQDLALSAGRMAGLINTMVEGLALHEIVLDENGVACDYRILDVNPAYEAMTGRTKEQVVGRRASEIRPCAAAKWLPVYAQVASTGKPARFEQYVETVDRYFEVLAYCPAPGQFATVRSDITDRLLSEKELRASEERLAALFEQAPLGYQSLDENGCFIEVNEAWLELLGYERDEVMGAWFGDFLAPEFVEPFRTRFPLFKQRGAIHSEFQMIHKDGSRRAIAFEGRIGHNADGTFKQTHCILSDITESKRAERELRETQQRLQAILDNTPALIYVKDPEGRFTLVNREFEKTFGRTHDELIGRTSHDLMDAEVADTHWANDQTVMASHDSLTIEEVNDEADGRHTYLTVKFPLYDSVGGLQGICGISTDVTEIKATERTLRERNQFIDAVLEHAPIGFAVNTIDDGVTVLISPSFERIYGVDPESVEGVEDFFEKVYRDPAVREQMRARIVADISSGEPARMVWEDIPLTSADGKLRYVTAMNIPLFEQNLMISTVQDVTDRKIAQDEVARQKARIQKTLTSVIDIASTIVETRDPYTAGHQRRVSEIAVRIATEMGRPASEVADIEVAALIHDVGKVQIPAEILGKPGPISPLEFEILKGHAEAGYRIVSSARMEEPIAEMVYQHHERSDGSGYPRGLTADQLLFGAKVLTVSDVVEAMMSHRPYRPALGIEAALAEIERGAGGCYDAEIAKTCVALFRDKGFSPT